MPVAIVPPGRNASAAALQKIFEDTQDKLIREILRKRSKGYVDYAEVAALERVRKTLQKMVKGAEKYVPLAVEHEFYKRPESAEAYRNARESINPGRTRAVEILSDNLLGEVEEMAETAYQSTASKLFLVGRAQEDIFREAALTSAVEASAAGRGSLTTVNEIIAAIQNTGITAFVDKAGHEWNLKAYGSMAVRTTVRQAQVAAVLTENQHDLYKIINTGVPCRWCAAYGGRVYSKSGMNKNYPPLTAAFGRIDTSGSDSIYNSFLNIHPNCQCSLIPYYEEDYSPEQVEKDRLYSDPARRPFDLDYRTKAVKEAYEQKERNRAVYRANVKQYRRYLESGVPGMPKHFQTFLKHKKLNDDKYKEWMSAYRKADKPVKAKPVMPVPKPKPVKPVVPEIPQVTNYSEVDSFLTGQVGFDVVEPSFSAVDKDLAISNANQLAKLESRFGVIHKSTGSICSVSDGASTNAYVRSRLVDPMKQNLSLCPGNFKNKKSHIESRKEAKESRWCMPFADKDAEVYCVTHEYGHMVQNYLKQQEMIKAGWTADNPYAFVNRERKTQKAQYKWYHELEQKVEKQHFSEIVEIATKNNPEFILRRNLSRYGASAYAEFFAEVFANSQLGEPNELGRAMIEWLAKKGF